MASYFDTQGGHHFLSLGENGYTEDASQDPFQLANGDWSTPNPAAMYGAQRNADGNIGNDTYNGYWDNMKTWTKGKMGEDKMSWMGPAAMAAAMGGLAMSGAGTVGGVEGMSSLGGSGGGMLQGGGSPGMFDDVFNFANAGGDAGGSFSGPGMDQAWNNPYSYGGNTGALNPGANLGNAAGWTQSGVQGAANLGYGGASLAGAGVPTEMLGSGFGSLASSAGGAAGGAGMDFWSQFKDIMSKPQIPGMPNSTGSNAAAGLLNYFMKQQQANSLNSAAGQAAQLNNPMNQPQRAPFQAAYLDLMMNPDSYKMTPFAQGQTNLANQQFDANVSKYGPSGTGFNQYLKNFQNIMSGDFFNLANQYSTAGGFNQGTGGAGSAFASLAGPAASAQNSAYEGFGRLFDQTPQQKTYQIQTNPQTGAVTLSQ